MRETEFGEFDFDDEMASFGNLLSKDDIDSLNVDDAQLASAVDWQRACNTPSEIPVYSSGPFAGKIAHEHHVGDVVDNVEIKSRGKYHAEMPVFASGEQAGKAAVGHELGSIVDGIKIIKKSKYYGRAEKVRVYADTGLPAPPGSEISKKKRLPQKREIITANRFYRRKVVVYSATGQRAPDGTVADGEQFVIKHHMRKVDPETGTDVPHNIPIGRGATPYWKYLLQKNGQLSVADVQVKLDKDTFVFSHGPQAGQIVAEEQLQAMDKKNIMSLTAYRKKLVRDRLVDAKTGENAPEGVKQSNRFCHEDDDEFITYNSWLDRNKVVYAESGKPAPKGSEPDGVKFVIKHDRRKINIKTMQRVSPNAKESANVMRYYKFLLKQKEQNSDVAVNQVASAVLSSSYCEILTIIGTLNDSKQSQAKLGGNNLETDTDKLKHSKAVLGTRKSDERLCDAEPAQKGRRLAL